MILSLLVASVLAESVYIATASPTCGIPFTKLANLPSQPPHVSTVLSDDGEYTAEISVSLPYDPLSAVVIGFAPFNPNRRDIATGIQACENRIPSVWTTANLVNYGEMSPLSGNDLLDDDIRYPGSAYAGLWTRTTTCETVTYTLSGLTLGQLATTCHSPSGSPMFSTVTHSSTLMISGELYVTIISPVLEDPEEYLFDISLTARHDSVLTVLEVPNPAPVVDNFEAEYTSSGALQASVEVTYPRPVEKRPCGYIVQTNIDNLNLGVTDTDCSLDACDALCISTCPDDLCTERFLVRSTDVVSTPLDGTMLLTWNVLDCEHCEDGVNSTPDIRAKVELESTITFEAENKGGVLLTHSRAADGRAIIQMRSTKDLSPMPILRLDACLATEATCVQSTGLIVNGAATGQCGGKFVKSDRSQFGFKCNASVADHFGYFVVTTRTEFGVISIPVHVDPNSDIEAIWTEPVDDPADPSDPATESAGAQTWVAGLMVLLALVVILM